MNQLSQIFNQIIPFADASRPLWQDAIYSLVLCTFLYFAPQLSFSQIQRVVVDRIQGTKRNQHLWQQDDAAPPHETVQNGQHPATQHIRPPAPTVEDDSSDSGSDDDSLNDEEIAALVRNAERQGALADPFAAGPADDPAFVRPPARDAHVVEQLQPALNGAAGTAGPGQPRRLRDPNRQVGAKKAKSLARRERVRAYHEFMREQGDMQRAQEASTAAERERELAEARARRAKVEAEIEEKARARREEKRKAEEQREKEEREAVLGALEMIAEALESQGRVEVRWVADAVGRDVEWVSQLIRREGMLDVKQTKDGKVMTMLTSKGWIVRVSEDDMRQLQAQASTFQGKVTGKVSWSEMGTLLDDILRKQDRIQ